MKSSLTTPRAILAAAATALMLGGAVLPAQADDTLTTIRVGFHPNMHSGGSLMVGIDQGFFAEEGLEVRTERFTSGGPEISAFGAGELDFGYIGVGAAVNLFNGLADVATLDNISQGDYVLARAGSGIETPADLAGKKVLVPEGTTGDIVLRQALASAGLKYSDIEALASTPDGAVTAFAAGEGDAIATWSPFADQISQQTQTVIVASDNPDDENYVSEDVAMMGLWLVSPSFNDENPEAVGGFVRAMGKANDYRNAHLEEIVEDVAAFTDSPVDALTGQITATRWLSTEEIQQSIEDGAMAGWFEALNAMFVDMGQIESVVPVVTYFDADAILAAYEGGADKASEPDAGEPVVQAEEGGGVNFPLVIGVVFGLAAVIALVAIVRRRAR